MSKINKIDPKLESTKELNTWEQRIKSEVKSKVSDTITKDSWQKILRGFINSENISWETEDWELFWKDRLNKRFNWEKHIFHYRDLIRKLETPASKKVTIILWAALMYEVSIFDELDEWEKSKTIRAVLRLHSSDSMKKYSQEIETFLESLGIEEIERLTFEKLTKSYELVMTSYVKYLEKIKKNKDISSKDSELIEKWFRIAKNYVKNIDFNSQYNTWLYQNIWYGFLDSIIRLILEDDNWAFDNFYETLFVIKKEWRKINYCTEWVLDFCQNLNKWFCEYIKKKETEEQNKLAEIEVQKQQEIDKRSLQEDENWKNIIKVLSSFEIEDAISVKEIFNIPEDWPIIIIKNGWTSLTINSIAMRYNYCWQTKEINNEINKIKSKIRKEFEIKKGHIKLPSVDEVYNEVIEWMSEDDNLDDLWEYFKKLTKTEQRISEIYNYSTEKQNETLISIKMKISRYKSKINSKIWELEDTEAQKEKEENLYELEREYLTREVESKIDYLISLYWIKSWLELANVKWTMSEDNWSNIWSVTMWMSQSISIRQEIRLIQTITILPDLDNMKIEMWDDNDKVKARFAMIDWVIPHEIWHLVDWAEKEKLTEISWEDEELVIDNIQSIIEDEEILKYLIHNCSECVIDWVWHMMAKEYWTSNPTRILEKQRIEDFLKWFVAMIDVVDYISKNSLEDRYKKWFLSFLIRLTVIWEQIQEDITHNWSNPILISKIKDCEKIITQLISEINLSEWWILDNSQIIKIKKVMTHFYIKWLNWDK